MSVCSICQATICNGEQMSSNHGAADEKNLESTSTPREVRKHLVLLCFSGISCCTRKKGSVTCYHMITCFPIHVLDTREDSTAVDNLNGYLPICFFFL